MAGSLGLFDLPTEILLDVLEELECQEVLSFALVSRQALQITQDERVWRALCVRDFGCQQHLAGSLQRKASERVLEMECIPPSLRSLIHPDARTLVERAGVIKGGMRAHYRQIRAISSSKSILHGTIFKAAMEATFGYVVHSHNNIVGRPLISVMEHCLVDWRDHLLERISDHSKIPEDWRAILLCKIYWTSCLGESELLQFVNEQQRNSFCHKEVEGRDKLASILTKSVSLLRWEDTSEVFVDVLLLLGAIPTAETIKRALRASFQGRDAFNIFERVLPKLLLALNYISTENQVSLSSVLDCCDVNNHAESLFVPHIESL